MNLHGIARGAVAAVNPEIDAVLLASTGYTTGANGKQVPTYATAVPARIQVQAATGKDLEHVNNMNIQGVLRAVYLTGNWNGVVRADKKGGDLFQFPQAPGGANRDWMVISITESWPDWTRVIVWLQAPGN